LRNCRAITIQSIFPNISPARRGSGGRIVHGLYTASLISAVIGMRLPGPGAVYVSQSLNFRGPVKIGDIVAVSVEVAELTEKGRRVRLHCECKVGETVVLDGEGILSVPARKRA
jgi:3-hydroxybutyryl-CoA dehydratase